MCLGEILSHAKKEAWHELPHVKPIKRVFFTTATQRLYK